jgi:metal-dependent hydrolase (beta-lactamase superfamily II)
MVFGGAHLRSASAERIESTTGRTRELALGMALGHCTGAAAEARFAEIWGERFHRLKTGWSWTQ